MLGYLGPRIANMALRALAMGSRFVLVLVLAKLLEPAEVGLFGLFVATVSFSMLIVGGEYYTYSQRELMSLPRERWSFVLQHQALAIVLLYILLLPPQLLLFWFDLLPSHWLLWFFSLLVVEHLAQEINRLLIAMRRPLVASWVLFIRMGAWVWILLPLMWFLPEAQALEAVFLAWLLGALAALVMGVAIVWREAAPWQFWPLDPAWLKRGVGVGLLFVGATMCFKALLTVDRYVVEYLAGPDLLGVYVLYAWIAMSVVNFLDPAVFSFLYPRLVGAYRQRELEAYRQIMKEMTWSAIGVSIALGFALAVFAPFVLHWIGRPVYIEHMPVLWLLLLMAVVYAAGMIPHYGLYARGADHNILVAHASSLAVFVITVIVVAPYAHLAVAAYGLLTAFTWMGVYKFWRYRSLVRQDREAGLGCVQTRSA